MMRVLHPDSLQDDESKGFSHNDLSLFVVKKQQQCYLYKNSCPHLGIELEWQPDQFLDIDAELIQCATHGALFRIEDGLCLAGPCQGESLTPVAYEIDTEGYICIDLA